MWGRTVSWSPFYLQREVSSRQKDEPMLRGWSKLHVLEGQQEFSRRCLCHFDPTSGLGWIWSKEGRREEKARKLVSTPGCASLSCVEEVPTQGKWGMSPRGRQGKCSGPHSGGIPRIINTTAVASGFRKMGDSSQYKHCICQVTFILTLLAKASHMTLQEGREIQSCQGPRMGEPVTWQTANDHRLIEDFFAKGFPEPCLSLMLYFPCWGVTQACHSSVSAFFCLYGSQKECSLCT